MVCLTPLSLFFSSYHRSFLPAHPSSCSFSVFPFYWTSLICLPSSSFPPLPLLLLSPSYSSLLLITVFLFLPSSPISLPLLLPPSTSPPHTTFSFLFPSLFHRHSLLLPSILLPPLLTILPSHLSSSPSPPFFSPPLLPRGRRRFHIHKYLDVASARERLRCFAEHVSCFVQYRSV